MNRPHAARAGAAIFARRAAGFQTSPGEGLDPRRIARARRGATRRRRPGRRTSLAVLFAMLVALFVGGFVPAAGAGPFGGDPCRPADNPSPEQYGSGTDGLIKPPDYPNAKLQKTPVKDLTYYDRYGTAGQSWYAVDMGCSDAMAMMGNALANTTFTLVRAIDRTTISVYQAAASESLLGWLKGTIDDVISSIGKTFNTRYWSWVVIVGAITLAWWGLVRRRASKVVEGVVWMVAAMVALIWLVARPADFTTLGTKVSEATSAAFNAALPQSSTKGGTCVPTPDGKPDPSTSANTDPTTRNANGLWVALVCKPWLMGEFGTTDPNAAIVKDNADKLLWSQAVDLPETYGGQKVDLAKKADAYKDVTKNIKDQHAGAYPLFQGKNWTSRLAVAFGALFAALVAGLLILVIAIALIVVKISFLLLLVAGPIFLGIGIQPGIGRVIAMRWLELLLSMLLKQAALIGVLALLLWAYGLILGETLPWGLQILLIALVTFAAFVYRKPFQHLFSAVGYSAVGAREKSEALLDRSASEARKNTAGVVTAVVPGAAGYRLGRAGKRDGAVEPATTDAADRRAGVAAAGAGDPQSPDAAPVLAAKPKGGAAGQGRPRKSAPPLNLPSRAASAPDGGGTAPRTTGGGTNGSGGGGGLGGIVTGGRSSGAGGGSGDGGSGGSGGSTPRPPSWGRGGGDGKSGAGRNGGGSGGRSGGSGGGSNGDGGRGRGGRSGSSPARGGGKDPASNVPRQRGGSGGSGGGKGGGRNGGGSGGGNSGGSGGGNNGGGNGGGAAPPPLWASRRAGGGGDGAPPMPFWLRPVDGDEP
ncbi:type IV secretion system protein [Actinomadura rayongensis]|uniref:Type IV secretion system protein n=1 Tax=Actinomadura rayongensis TaxID=1429076 RepID=A0A6I4W3B3_9ACTN|nr:type IV secretion system protein [Actinomadura rayongensis]MXQ62925.1 hypothetical protein [Actinomadura rayongensis]